MAEIHPVWIMASERLLFISMRPSGREVRLLIHTSIPLNTLLHPFDRSRQKWFNLAEDPKKTVGVVL